MLSFRTFRNTDPPAVIDIWRSRAGQPGLLQPVSADLFEQLVFAKPYFDCHGLIIADDDGRAVGFAHAGFGPNDCESDISTDLGVTCVALVRPECPTAEVAAGLLRQTEQYLRGRGAKVLYGGAIRPLNPFYLGLYGGAELPGILVSDRVATELFRSQGYREIDQTLVFRRDLTDFQVPMDRAQLALRRQMTIQMTVDPPSRSWWDACTTSDFDLTRFEVMPRGGGQVLARATFRGMEPSGASTFVRAAGLIDLEVDAARRRQGLATYLLGEAFQNCSRQGIMLVEVQTMARNAAAIALYRKLGFRQADQGVVFRKDGA
jgi:GNAT superfamily N-acetyltransferase